MDTPLAPLTRPFRSARMTLLVITAVLATVLPCKADDFDLIRARMKEMIDGGNSYNPTDPDIAARLNVIATTIASNGTSRNPSTGTGFWDKLNTTPDRTHLWSDLTDTSGPNITAAYSRIRAMALAYSTHGSVFAGNADLLNDTRDALAWMHEKRYREPYPQEGNWWDWQIGAPTQLNEAVTLLYDHLDASQISNYMDAVDHYTPTPGGGTLTNRMWFCKVLAYCGVLSKDSSRISTATNGVNSLFNFTSSGDGFYRDGSFLFHNGNAYSGGYGLSLGVDLADYLFLFLDTPWAPDNSKWGIIHSWLNNTFEPIVFKGEVFDVMRGREPSRYRSPSHNAGRRMIRLFMRAAQFSPPGDALHYQRVVKHWLLTDTTFARPTEGLAIYDALLAQSILADPAITPRTSLNWYTQFSGMARAVAHRHTWAAAISMHSTQVKNFESGSGENLKGWHTTAGMLSVHTDDLNQFSDNFWPTVNPYRLPGTTVEAGHGVADNKFGSQSFVGGVESWSGLNGVSAMSIGPYGRTLRGHKAWFVFDDEIVALGAGITASGGSAVATIVENRKLTSVGSNAFSVNGTSALPTLQTAPATVTPLTGVTYAVIEGNVPTNDGIGYYFPTPTSLKGTREARTANWSSINTAYPNTTLYTRNYLSLWFDHGINPAAGSYAYAVLPGANQATMASYAAAPDFTILENSTSAQAIKETTLDQVGAIFWTDTVKTVGTGIDAITSDKKAAVFVTKSAPGEVQVGVSDPTQLNTGAITITLGATASGVVEKDPSITVISLSPTIQFSVNAANLKGVTQRIHFGVPVAPPSGPWKAIDNPPSPQLTYTGTWTHSPDAAYYNATKSVSNTIGSYADLTFTGTGIRLYVRTAPSLGKLNLSVNNGTPVSIDCYSDTNTMQVKVFEVTGLPSGQNSLRATVALKSSESSGNYVGLDYFEVLDSWTAVDNLPSADVAYTGTWAHSSDPAYYNTTKSVSNTLGSYVDFTFIGTGARLYVRRAPSLGKLNISINNGSPASIDCYSETDTMQTKVFEVTGLPPGQNSLRATVAMTQTPPVIMSVSTTLKLNLNALPPTSRPSSNSNVQTCFHHNQYLRMTRLSRHALRSRQQHRKAR